jgi:hypothetical protein
MSKPRSHCQVKISLNPFERLLLDRDVLRDECLDLRHRNAQLVLQLARRKEEEEATAPFDAKSEAGITTNLLDAIQAIAAVLKDRSTDHPHCRAALADLGSDKDFGSLFNAAIDAAYDAESDE